MAYTSEAFGFLQGTGKSSSGYTLKQILLWGDDSWENEHDFIQWIFPNDKPSNFNTDRLVVDAKKSQDLGSFDNNLKIYSGTLNF